MKGLKWLATVSAFALTVCTVPALADVKIEDIVNDAATTNDVVSNGLGPQGQRYSTLTAINKENVANLAPAWAMSLGGEKMRGQETQPLVKDGVMYITGSYSRMWAIDVKTGREIWQYDHRLPEGILPCCDVVNRGAALYGDKVIFGTLDAKLVGLDAKTGKVVWTKEIDDFKAGYSYTAAPLIVPTKAHGALLLTGVSGGEFGVVGRVEGRKVDTGELVWSRPTIEGHMGSLNGKPSTMTGEGQRKLAGRPLEDGRRRHMARRHVRSGYGSGILRHRQPRPVEQPHASGRQQVVVLAHRHRSGNRRNQVGLSDDPERWLGLRRRERSCVVRR